MATINFIEAQKQAALLADKQGYPMDPYIVDTVAALWAHNINTVGSCEGHIGRVTGGPYVLFESPLVKEYRDKYKQITDKTSPEFKYWYKKATQANMVEVQKVLTLLEGFYNNRLTPNNQRLIVRCFDTAVGKLMCQGADLAHILNKQEQEDLLQKNQAEVRMFTDYIKGPSRRMKADARGMG